MKAYSRENVAAVVERNNAEAFFNGQWDAGLRAERLAPKTGKNITAKNTQSLALAA